jgi:diguanylate cyclase (GGDEF)-like protein
VAVAEQALRRRAGPLALIIFDLDHFKEINRRYLHPGGDAALCQLGSLLATIVMREVFVGRFGGDRFLVVAAGAARPQALALAERIRVAIQEAAFTYCGETIKLTATFGVAVAEPGVPLDPSQWEMAVVEGGVSDELQPVVQAATAAMERAKSTTIRKSL